MRALRWAALLLVSGAVVTGAGFAAPAKPVPFLSGRVVDDANLLSAGARQALEVELAAFEKQTTDQLVVLIVPSLDGEPLEEYSVKVAQTWGLGHRGKDNGVLLLVAREDRKLRLEVGYGLEGTLTDLKSREILDDIVRPHFKQSDYDGGVEAGVDAVIKVLNGQPLPAHAASAKTGPGLAVTIFGLLLFTVVVGTFSVIAVGAKGALSWFLYVFLLPFYVAFPAAFLGPLAGGLLALGWLVAFPILKYLARSRGYFSPKGSHGAFWTAIASSGSGGSSGSSSGGFSGDGGSFGGGGASSGW